MRTHQLYGSQHGVDVGWLASGRCWRASIIEKDLRVQNEVYQTGLILAQRSAVLIKLERTLERLFLMLAVFYNIYEV